MWVATQDGFYSVVQHRDKPSMVLVRARAKKDLEALLEVLQGKTTIFERPKADYPYAITISKKHWTLYLEKAVENIDYHNFKSRIAKLNPFREFVYSGVWAVCADITKEETEGTAHPIDRVYKT